ncbi:hypothetical protein JM84_1796 [Dokdonia sp. Hel_I_63]|uniref:hypothetical protein n=1 Tax=unclassified Dokdonia TaxID=2615033 RepID=UPI000551B728|nr:MULTISPECIES: hypothetical protein [unclassified Dokdonia]TVZ22882.1 hypothetical protein JM84_1796 [Dokdonia sp. Hel_I_63]
MPTETKKSDNVLEQFLSEFETLVSGITEHALKNAEDEDEKAVIQSFAPSLNNQIFELNQFIREGSKKSSKQQEHDVIEVLKISSGVSLAKNAKGMFPSIGSLVGKLGIDRIIKEIKKIIYAILDMIGIKLPKWLDKIINLIDEIIAFILSGGSSKMMTTFSIQEQNYLNELTQLAKLEQAHQFKFQEDEDEE